MELGHWLRGWRRMTIVFVVTVVVAASWSESLDKATRDYVSRSTIQALTAFATARVLNAGITVAKSVEIGIGVSVKPLEILDPVHDLVEKYSSIMKLAIGSLITQKLLLEIVGSGFFRYALAALGILLIAAVYLAKGQYAPLFIKLFALGALVRFLFVLTIALSALVDQAYVNRQTEANMAQVKVLADQVERLETASALSLENREMINQQLAILRQDKGALVGKLGFAQYELGSATTRVEETQARFHEKESEIGWFNSWNPFFSDDEMSAAKADLNDARRDLEARLKFIKATRSELLSLERRIDESEAVLSGETKQRWFSGLASTVSNVVDFTRFEGLKERLQNVIENILALMALFIFKTLVMPLMFFWALLKSFQYIWGVSLGTVARDEVEFVRKQLRRETQDAS